MATRQREMKKAELGAGIARRLRAKRLELAVSTDTLAAAAGVGRAQVVRTEAGQGGGCRLDTLTLLADALSVRPEWLIFGLGDEPIPMLHAVVAPKPPRTAKRLA